MTIQPKWFYSLTLIGLAASAYLGVGGVSLVPVAIFSTALWMLVLWQRWNVLLSVSVTVLCSVWALSASQYLIASLRLNAVLYFELLWALLGLVAWLLLLRRRGQLRSTTWAAALVWLAPAIVGAGYLVLYALGAFGWGSVGLTWAMSGDAPTMVTQARDIANLGGNEIWNNAVPLPAALAAMAMIAGRDQSLVLPTLQHDVEAFALVWALAIAFTCWACGALVVAIMRRSARTNWELYIVGLGSALIPLTWFYSGYATYYGFFNSTIALCATLLTVIAFVAAKDKPLVLLGTLFMATTLTFLTWSPLIFVPVGLGIYVFFRNLTTMWRAPAGEILFSVFGLVQILGFIAWQAIPLFFETQGSGGSSVPGSTILSLTGAAIYFRPQYIAFIFAATLVTTVLAGWKRYRYEMWGFLVILLALALGFVYMVYGSGDYSFPWLYYPSKFIWVSMQLIIPIALGTGLAWLLGLVSASWLTAIALVVVAGGAFGFFKVTATWGHINGGVETPTALHELFKTKEIFEIDKTPNRDVARQTFALESQDHLRILWQSGNPWEDNINFWLLKMWSISDHGSPRLGDFTYGVQERSLANLCQVLITVKSPVELVTSNPILEQQLSSSCPSVHPFVTKYAS